MDMTNRDFNFGRLLMVGLLGLLKGTFPATTPATSLTVAEALAEQETRHVKSDA